MEAFSTNDSVPPKKQCKLFASTAWSPYTKKDIEALEKVQTRCLRLCNDKIQIETLQERRMATDLVDTYKFLNGHYKTKPDTFFSTPSKDLRGHSHKQFYSNRVVQPWNSLPEYVVSAPTVASFKNRLRALPLGKEG